MIVFSRSPRLAGNRSRRPSVPHRSSKAARKKTGDPWSARNVATVVNGMLVGVSGVFLVTKSVPVTIIATVAALTLGVVVALGRK